MVDYYCSQEVVDFVLIRGKGPGCRRTCRTCQNTARLAFMEHAEILKYSTEPAATPNDAVLEPDFRQKLPGGKNLIFTSLGCNTELLSFFANARVSRLERETSS